MHAADDAFPPAGIPCIPSPGTGPHEDQEHAASSEAIVPQCIATLRELLGDVVFLACNSGKGGKGPFLAGFQKLTRADMTPQHLAECERPEYRIGVLLGTNSGGLCGLDCDDDGFAAEILRLNPWLAQTLITTCNRGCAHWLRVTDRWPKTAPLYWRGRKVGEWRADGSQSVIAGQDTETKNLRRFVVRQSAASVSWRIVRWPEGLEAGGEQNRRPWPPETSDTQSFITASPLPSSHSNGGADVEREDVERRLRSTSLRTRSTSPRPDERSEKEQKQQRLYRELVSHHKAQKGNRNALLNHAVPFLIHTVCQTLVLSFFMRHFDEIGKPGGWAESREKHQRSVEGLIAGCLASYPEDLIPAERTIYEGLGSDRDRAAFRICRDLAQFDDTKHHNPPGIFPLAYGELAARLDCANVTAEELLKSRFLAEKGVISIESPGFPRRKGYPNTATRWRWLLQAAGEPMSPASTDETTGEGASKDRQRHDDRRSTPDATQRGG